MTPNLEAQAIAFMLADLIKPQRYAILYQRSPGESSRVVAHDISEPEAREIMKLVANDHRQVVAAPLAVTSPAGQKWEAVPVELLQAAAAR